MKKMSFRKMWLLLAFACLSAESQAQMSGSGTESDPYLVKTPDDLFDVRNDLSACYKMANDINLTEWIAEENPTNGWEPSRNSFFGIFDGDGHTISGLYINRPNEDVGLFRELQGSIKNVVFNMPYINGKSAGTVSGFGGSGSITNVKVIGGYIHGSDYSGAILGYGGTELNQNVVISTHIIGNTYCGGIVGCKRANSQQILSNDVIECDINGKYVGGIAGGLDISNSYKLITIARNYFSGTLTGASYTGGIVGYAESASSTSSYTFSVYIERNRSDGNIVGKGIATSGVCTGCKNGSNANGNFTIMKNIITGTIYGESNVKGISASSSYYNVCAADSLKSNSVMPERIGYNNSNYDNYAYNGMVIMKNGVTQTVNDGNVNGLSRSLRMLMRKNTYTAVDYDFTYDWEIIEGVTLPYYIYQSTPSTIEKCLGGENSIVSGTAIGSGKIYVFVNGEMTTGEVTNGQWSVSLGNVAVGTTVKVSVETQGMKPSIITTAVATDPSEDTTEQCATPTIIFVGGKLHFECETEGVTYHYNVTIGTAGEQTGNDKEVPTIYTISVYASKDGYSNSEVATKEINLKGDINGDGEITSQDASLILQYIAKKITW